MTATDFAEQGDFADIFGVEWTQSIRDEWRARWRQRVILQRINRAVGEAYAANLRWSLED